ncbi:hypothetical protein EV200_102185 [Pedobacter psychrotolerans]|uniref:Uncharacterized protein n=1 Tax=Pedobacter psychrotolerans TaxID=1843235 RepID=A0A4R2HK47_9SPHI|nr:hypothetical protein EV200_102185 [Pedobacter psychrotolerans]
MFPDGNRKSVKVKDKIFGCLKIKYTKLSAILDL